MSDQGNQSKEIEFWSKCIEEAGEPALELGSGTGRILVPLLERGHKVVGIDTSEDMLEMCITRCKEKSLRAELHEQSMLDFRLRRCFSIMFLDSGGLGLFTADKDINALFNRVFVRI